MAGAATTMLIWLMAVVALVTAPQRRHHECKWQAIGTLGGPLRYYPRTKGILICVDYGRAWYLGVVRERLRRVCVSV